jgi:hypothetical protein
MARKPFPGTPLPRPSPLSFLPWSSDPGKVTRPSSKQPRRRRPATRAGLAVDGARLRLFPLDEK